MAQLRKTFPAGRFTRSGFTLVEVMIAAAILAIGVVAIFESFFICLDAYNYCSRYLSLVSWADDKIWEAQDSINRFGAAAHIGNYGSFLNKNKPLTWYLNYASIDENNILYKISLSIYWQEGVRKGNLQRSAYAIYEERK